MSTHTSSSTAHSTPPASPRRGNALPRVLGALELLAVAAASMFLVDPVLAAALNALGWSALIFHPAGAAVAMTVDICIGTAVWMLARNRSTRSIIGFIVAVAVAFALPLPLFWSGALSGTAAVLLGHVLVIPAVVLLVAFLPGDLGTGRGRVVRGADGGGIRLALDRIARRWPTLLALLLTFGKILDPSIAPSWVLVVLGAEYVVIGMVRRQFRDRRLLRLHIIGALAYAALAVLTMFVDPTWAGILIGLGWLLHAGWDIALHRANIVVWRWYAEACAVFDVVVGVAAIVAALALRG